jgi:hypothetical protein
MIDRALPERSTVLKPLPSAKCGVASFNEQATQPWSREVPNHILSLDVLFPIRRVLAGAGR